MLFFIFFMLIKGFGEFPDRSHDFLRALDLANAINQENELRRSESNRELVDAQGGCKLGFYLNS